MTTEGFYTKKEAATILGVSERQINNYISQRKLRRIKRGRSIEIPIVDVDALYSGQIENLPPGREEFSDLARRLEATESAIEVLKLGLGHGAKRKVRGLTELLLARQRCLDDISKVEWSPKRMSALADELMQAQEEEVRLLAKELGDNAWMPVCDLANRMLAYIEHHPAFPERGLDVLQQRLVNARSRFFGMLYVASKIESALSQKQARKVRASIEVHPSAMDHYILQYIEGQPSK